MRRLHLSAGCWVLGILIGASFAARGWSQEQTTQSPAKSQIRAVTNEVIVPVTVTDASGEFVLDLTQNDFHVFDDGAEQTIDHGDLEGDPLTVALLIDTSSRFEALAPVIRHLGSIFTETVMALDGEAAVISYDSTVEVRQGFTTDHDAVEKAIAQTKLEAPEMDLYDGMAATVSALNSRPSARRRIMLIVGESEDTGSKASLRQVLRDAELDNITIYAVGPSSISADYRGSVKDPIPLKLPKLPPIKSAPCVDAAGMLCEENFGGPIFWLVERGEGRIRSHELTAAAAATGGIHYGAFKDSAVRSALDRIGSELHAQYILTYRPNGKRSVGYHTIEVKLSRSGVSVRARPGYYVAPSAE